MDIHSWLSNSTTESEDKRYRHRLLRENLEQRTKIIGELTQYFCLAHKDARQRLEKLTGDSLDPLDDSTSLKKSGYPEELPLKTLKGYFGEVMVALFIEKFAPFGNNNWKVPAFLFRFHIQAFQYLEELLPGKDKREVFGRTGNDCLAFQRNDKNEVTHILCCEAKCTNNGGSDLITEALEQISKVEIVDIPQIIEILTEKTGDPNSQQWISSLQKFRFSLPTRNYQRYDLVSYVCGQSPQKPKTRNTWIDPNQPHEKYTGKRPLEAVEIHLHDVDKLIKEVYGKQS